MTAGVIVFGFLGNLAEMTGNEDLSQVIQGGSGMAFVSYPDAISKFEMAPQVFSAFFFFMLFLLGIGTTVGMSSCVMTAIRDRFPMVKNWQVAIAIAVVQFSIGIVYLTPVMCDKQIYIILNQHKKNNIFLSGRSISADIRRLFLRFIYHVYLGHCGTSCIRMDLWSVSFVPRH